MRFVTIACRAIIPGRPFLRRLYDATKGIENPKYLICVSAHMKEDLAIWLNFLSNFNRRIMFLSRIQGRCFRFWLGRGGQNLNNRRRRRRGSGGLGEGCPLLQENLC